MIAKWVFVGAADAGFCIVAAAADVRGGVVLDDVVLPIGEPDGAVGAHLSENGGHPFIAAGDERETVVGCIAGTIANDVKQGDNFHRGLANHGFALEPRGQII